MVQRDQFQAGVIMDLKAWLDLGGWGVSAALVLYAWRQFEAGKWVFGWLYQQLADQLLKSTTRAEELNQRMEAMMLAHQNEIEERIEEQQRVHQQTMQQMNQRLHAKQQTIDRLTGATGATSKPGEVS